MDVRSLGFRTDLMLLRMTGSTVTDHGTHLVVRTPDNPGYWWGNFVLCDGPPREGDAVRWGEVFRAEFPAAAHLALGVDGVDGDAGDVDELGRLGVATEVSTVLTATRLTPPAPRPAAGTGTGIGTVIRPLESDDDWAQARDLSLACEGDGTSSDEHRLFVERKLAEHRRAWEAGHGAWFGAFAGGRMCSGAGLFGDGSGVARFQDVQTHPDHRRRGLASAVVHHAGRWGQRELGAGTLVIVADPDYHAIGIYRALGFADTERQVQLCRAPAA